MSDFGSQMRAWRKESHMTLVSLSAKLGLSVGYLSRMETGSRPPADSVIEAWACALGRRSEIQQARRLAKISLPDCRISLRGRSDAVREMVVAIKRAIDDDVLEDATALDILEILEVRQ